ncbi:MAG: MoaD/ThiS family protein, partial [Chloroflexi bacterium]|nr:MoaD/ThiS family protein [Chloroflexota bacterium]
MSISVRIPTPLRRVTDGADKVDADGATLEEIIGSLESQYPGIKARLCDEEGELRNFVNVYINGEAVRFLDGIGTATKRGAAVTAP